MYYLSLLSRPGGYKSQGMETKFSILHKKIFRIADQLKLHCLYYEVRYSPERSGNLIFAKSELEGKDPIEKNYSQ